jgi:hypothetical protein
LTRTAAIPSDSATARSFRTGVDSYPASLRWNADAAATGGGTAAGAACRLTTYLIARDLAVRRRIVVLADAATGVTEVVLRRGGCSGSGGAAIRS